MGISSCGVLRILLITRIKGVFMDGIDLKYGDGKVIRRLRVELSLDEILVKIGRAAEPNRAFTD
jgi:hypothetical protein